MTFYSPGKHKCKQTVSVGLLYTKYTANVIKLCAKSKQKKIFFRSANDCQRFCDDARAFNCRSFAQKADRCYLSGDDSIALPEVTQPVDLGALYREKVCTRSKFFLQSFFIK